MVCELHCSIYSVAEENGSQLIQRGICRLKEIIIIVRRGLQNRTKVKYQKSWVARVMVVLVYIKKTTVKANRPY